MEIDNLTEGADIVRFIKGQRIKWLGHIQRMDRARPTGKLLDWRPVGTRPLGRPRQRWQEDVMEDLKKQKVKNWKETAKDRRTWRNLAEKSKTHKGFFYWYQLDTQFLYKLYKIKFLYMFRASSAHLQEVNDVNCTCMQPLVFSFSTGGLLVHLLRGDCSLPFSKCTRQPPAQNENTRGCIHVQLTSLTSWRWADDARNM